MPGIVAGLRTAAVEVVSSATLAAFIGGGGLGVFITRGFALLEPRIMLVGAVSVALLALLAELLLALLQRRLSGAAA
jgi:osmoprotectant transport system permease protein